MEIVLTQPIIHDDYTAIANQCFDVPIEDISTTTIHNNIKLPEQWQIGVIHGSSGSGKSTLLNTFGTPSTPIWDNTKSIISNFTEVSPDEASQILCAVGLSSIPAWLRSYNHLSTGEKFRADLARLIAKPSSEPILIDEFTSVVDRTVAKAASHALQKYIRKTGKQVIVATCHEDILEWLQPDWTYSPVEAVTKYSRGCLRRPPIKLQIFRTHYQAWELFQRHHYLTHSLPKASRCYVATWNDKPVAFISLLRFPHAVIKDGWRISRLVVLPDYQGLGIGTRLADHIASMVTGSGGRCYIKTAHPGMIAHFKSSGWRTTGKGSQLNSPTFSLKNWNFKDRQSTVSFEYIGKPADDCAMWLENVA